MKILKILEDVKYRGEHTAPDRNSGDPLHNVTQSVYPENIYSSNAARYYGDGRSDDSYVIGIIQGYRNTPNKKIKIYRSVPRQINEHRVSELKKLYNYYNKFGFFPVGNKIVHSYEDKYDHLGWDEKQESVYDAIVSDIKELSSKNKIKINSGDWVTINKQYALEHGHRALNNNFRIIEKTVKAKDLYTNGDSIHEWGYDPS